jgi:uncharacterized protein with FMN-binding domain
MKRFCTADSFHSLPLILLLFAVFPAAAWGGGIHEHEVGTIPTGSYAGNYIRNSEKYTAVLEIEAGEISEIRLTYNGSPLDEPWAREQAAAVLKNNSTRVPTISSPGGRNKSVLKAIELALRAGLKLAE